MGREVAGSGHRITRILAYTAVYVLWGGSFLAVREIVVAAPPFLAASVRFLIAGLVLIVWGRAIRAPIPTRREIGSTALLGLILFAINYACLFWAEQRVASGYAAVISATVPVWVFAGEWLVLRAFRPSAAAITGMVFGISGVALLVLPGSGGEWTFAALALLVGAICWAGGTLLSLRIPMPRSRHVSAGLQMWFGGLMLLVLSAVSGDLWRFGETARIWNLRCTQHPQLPRALRQRGELRVCQSADRGGAGGGGRRGTARSRADRRRGTGACGSCRDTAFPSCVRPAIRA